MVGNSGLSLRQPFSGGERFVDQPSTINFRSLPHYLLVIPAFRESERLPRFLPELLERLARCSVHGEVLVVDDGSGAEEQARLSAIVAELRATFPQLRELVCHPQNRGKGAAIRAGWEMCEEHQWLGFVDADGAVPAQEVCRLLEMSATSEAALFGCRVRMLGRSIERSLARHLTGRLFATLVGCTISPHVYDPQCGLKLIPAAAYRRIARWLQEEGFCFDVELLAALLHARLGVREVPIDWHDRPGSHVSLWRDTWRMFRDVRRISVRRKTWPS